jgi:acetylornithine/N-succinyldiaminopimelate aminotransferase
MVLQAGPDVIRLAPSLVIEQGELDEGLARLEAAAMQLSHVQQSTSENVEI